MPITPTTVRRSTWMICLRIPAVTPRNWPLARMLCSAVQLIKQNPILYTKLNVLKVLQLFFGFLFFMPFFRWCF